MQRRNWKSLLVEAAQIVNSYDTGVTLRQLFYRLVSAELLPNTSVAYSQLSDYTAARRRAGTFPTLIDRTRRIHRYQSFEDVQEARSWLAAIYRRDRTEGQPWSIYVGVEKAGIVEQLESWFGEYGFPIVALGGYSSQTFVDEIAADAKLQERPAVLVYAGDFDPSGEDIDRDLVERTGCFEQVVRVAVNAKQVRQYRLPPMPGKVGDSRSAQFVEKHGRLVQVELDALAPDVLRGLYTKAIEPLIDKSKFNAALRREARERKQLTK